MEIEMIKDPFDYRKFYHVLKYKKKEIDNDDAELLGQKVCSELKKKTKVQWFVNTCVGGKCNIGTKRIMNRDKRKKLKGEIIEIPDVKFLE
jgi:hypothetical protein